MSALLEAIQRKDQAEQAIELLRNERIKSLAANNDNEALHWAAYKGHLRVVQELLKIKSVSDNLVAENNEALRLAAENGHLLLVLELLKLESIKAKLNVKDHQALRVLLKDKNQLGIANLVCKIYGDNEFPIPEELMSQYDKHSKDLSEQNKSVEGMNKVVITIFQNNIKALTTLLEDENVRKVAEIGNNLVLRFAIAYGHLNLVSELLKLEKVVELLAKDNDETLRFAIAFGQMEIVTALLKVPAIQNQALKDNYKVILQAAKHQYWNTVTELLQIDKVQTNLAGYVTDLLRIVTQADQLSMTLSIVNICKNKVIPVPSLTFQFGEKLEPLSTLSDKLEAAKRKSSKVLSAHRLPPPLITMVWSYYSYPGVVNNPEASISKKRPSAPCIIC